MNESPTEIHMKITESQARNIGCRAVAIGFGIIYYLTFLTCYYYLISPNFSYAGMTFFMLPYWAWVVSILLSLLPLLWMPVHFTRPSDFASWFLYLFLIFPSNIIIPMVSNLSPSGSVKLLIALNGSFILFEFVRRTRWLFAIHHIKSVEILFRVFLPIITITLSLVFFAYAKFKFNFSFADIYVRRLEARNILSSGSLAGYLESFLKSICIMIGIIYGLQKRKWVHITISIFAAFAIFSLSGEKWGLFSPLFFILIYFMSSRNRRNLGLIMLVLIILLVGLSLVEGIVAKSKILAFYFVRRMLVIPSQLTTYYWDFFSQNPFVMMKDSIIGWLIPVDANYLIPKARLIGLEYFGNIEMNANANIWATAYADFGYYGMVITSILAALTLKVIDSLGARGKFVVASVCSASIGLIWAEGGFYTSFLSNGVFLIIIVLWLYPLQHSHWSEIPKFMKIHAIRKFME